MANLYIVKLEDGVVDGHGVNAHMVAAYDEKGAIDVCVDSAKTEDIDLWYDAEVEFVCEVPKSINDRRHTSNFNRQGLVMSWLLFMQLCLLMLIAAILYKAVDDTKGGKNDKD